MAVTAMAATALIQYIIMKFVLNLGGKLELGYYSFIVSVISPILIFFNFGIRNLVSTSAINGVANPQIFALKLIGIILSLISLFVAYFFLSPTTVYLFLFVAVLKLFDSISDMATAFYYSEKKMKVYLCSSMVKLFGVIIACLVSLHENLVIQDSIIVILVIYILAQGLDIQLLFKKFESLNFDFTTLKKGAFLGGASVIASLITMFPRFFLGYQNELAILADLAVLIFLVSLVNMAWNSYLMLRLSDFSSFFLNRKPVMHFIVKNYISLIILCFVFSLPISTIFGNDIIQLLFDNSFEYSNSELFMVVLLVSSSMLQALANNILIARGFAGSLTKNNIIFLCLSAVLFLFFFNGTLISALIILTFTYSVNFVVNFYKGVGSYELH